MYRRFDYISFGHRQSEDAGNYFQKNHFFYLEKLKNLKIYQNYWTVAVF